jgi:hypothetical protein
MVQAALDYVVANQTGRTDIWICSDLRQSDWKSDDGRWSAMREGFERLDGIRFYLLSYPETAGDNWAVSVTDAKRRQVGKTAELVLDVALRRESVPRAPEKIPLELTINGARSVLNLETAENEYILQGHTIPLDANTDSGWGRVTVPVDANTVDNEYYFVFSEPPEHHTVIVSDDSRTADLLRLAAVSPVDPALLYDASVLTSDRIAEIDWNATSLVMWHAPLPDAVAARPLQDFVDSGRPVIFFPPEQRGSNELFGAKWGDWQRIEGGQPAPVASWRGESDLLSHTRSGAPLPVGKLRVQRYCPLQGGGSALSRLEGGQPLLIRAADTDGPVYFMTTLPRADCSSLAQDGVVFYVMIQRALSVGAARLGKARQLTAGTDASQEVARWEMLSESPDAAFQSDRPLHAGAYQEGDKLIALNRPPSEDLTRTLDDVAVGRIFRGLDYRQVKDRIGNSSSLASEIWRALLIAMAVALLIEAWLCMPEQKRQESNQPSATSGQFAQKAA